MAKTIQQMAEKYVEERRDLDVGRANAQFNCFDMIDAVKFGANCVLEQIEQLIYEKHVKGNLPLFDLTYLIDKLREE